MRSPPLCAIDEGVICPTGSLVKFVSSLLAKNISLRDLVETALLIPTSRSLKRGGSRSSRTLGTGCDGRGSVRRVKCARTSDVAADGEVVWFWRPDAGAKSVVRPTDDGGKRARSPGRARRTPLKPLRRECRLMRCTCGC